MAPDQILITQPNPSVDVWVVKLTGTLTSHNATAAGVSEQFCGYVYANNHNVAICVLIGRFSRILREEGWQLDLEHLCMLEKELAAVM